MDLSNYQGIIFDMDGTLVDSMPGHINAWKQTCRVFNIPFDYDWFYSMGGSPTLNTAKALLIKYQLDIEPSELVESKSAFFDDIAHKGNAIPETFAILQQQKVLKKRTAVGTGCQRRHAQEILTSLGMERYLDVIVTADDVTKHKPLPDTFLEAARQIGVAPEHCVVFEDTELGYQAAKAAGMDCYLVNDGKVIEFRPFKG